MPFYIDNSEEELKKQQAEQSGNNISGQSTIINNPNAAPNSKPGAAKSSGSWTNLQSYLDANKENASQMSSNIADKVDFNATNAQNAINTYKTSAPTETHKYNDQELNDEFYTDPSKADKSKYDNIKNTGGYSGPQYNSEVTGYDDAQKKTNTASSQLKNLSNEEGRINLLNDAYQRPNYSQGQKTFDNLLLQNDPTAKDKFNSIAQKWTGLDTQLTTANTDVSGRIDTNKQTALKNKNLFPGLEDKTLSSVLDPITQRVTAEEAKRPTTQDDLKNHIANKSLTEDDLKALGLNVGDRLYGLDLNSFVTYDQSKLNEDLLATPEERAKYNALTSLMGKDSIIGNDQKSYSPYTVDKDYLKSTLQAKDSEFKDWARNQNIHTSAVSNDPLSSTYRANTDINLFNYLNDPNSIRSYSDWTDAMSVDPGEGVKSSLDQQARTQAFSQLMALLDQWNYRDQVNGTQNITDQAYTVDRAPGNGLVGGTPQPSVGVGGNGQIGAGGGAAPITYDPNIVNNPGQYVGDRLGFHW